MPKNLPNELLYESVKTIVECPDKHIHLPQHKLFTLFSIAFQYLLFKSTQEPGLYILRLEDRGLADKLARKAKDERTRRFLARLILPRKMKYEQSNFFLDYFQMGSWARTNELDRNKIKAALIVKNTTSQPMSEFSAEAGEEPLNDAELNNIEDMLYFKMLAEFVPRTISIGYDSNFPGTTPISFPFIKKEEHRGLSGVKLSEDIKFED